MLSASPAKSKRLGVGSVRTTWQGRQNVQDVLDSSWYSPGKWCRRFEREWAALHGRKYAVFVNSGTSALQIALASLKEKHGWQTGAKVVVPATTFVASVNVVLQERLRPVFMDVDRYYGLDISGPPLPDTVDVMPVNINGQRADMERILAWAELY